MREYVSQHRNMDNRLVYLKIMIVVYFSIYRHTSTAITEKVYAEFLPDTLGEVVDGLDFKF